jgi:hypothetical protein
VKQYYTYQYKLYLNNDLTIAANNNILLNPSPTLDIKIPVDAGIRFGSGYQRVILKYFISVII